MSDKNKPHTATLVKGDDYANVDPGSASEAALLADGWKRESEDEEAGEPKKKRGAK